MIDDDFLSAVQCIIKEEMPHATIRELVNISVSIQKSAGGERVYIPKYSHYLDRNMKIYNDYRTCSMSICDIASKYSLSERNIRRILQQNGAFLT